MDKKIIVRIDRAPSMAVAERLRMSVGLTLEDSNRVTLYFVDEGVLGLSGFDSGSEHFDFDKHLKMLGALNVPILADGSAAKKRYVNLSKFDAKAVDRSEATLLIGNADVVLG